MIISKIIQKLMASMAMFVIAFAPQMGFAANTQANYSINITPTDGGMAVFYGCELGECEVIGNAGGYPLENFEANPKLQKTFAVGLGLGETAVTAVVGIFSFTFFAFGAAALSAPGGVSIGYKVAVGAAAVTGVVATGTTPVAATKMDGINPAHHWRVSNVNRK